MECNETRSLLSEYIDGALDKDTASRVRSHLESCRGCTETHESIKRMIGLMMETEMVEEPADLLENVRMKVERRVSPGERIRRWFGAPIANLSLKAAAVALVALLLVHLPGDLRDRSPSQLLLTSDTEKLDVITTFETRGPSDQSAPVPKEAFSEEPLRRQAEGAEDEEIVDREAADVGHEQELQVVENDAAVSAVQVEEKTEPVDSRGKDLTIDRAAESQLRHIVDEMAGRVVESELDQNFDRVVSLVVEIPEDKYSSFMEELDNLQAAPVSQPVGQKSEAQTVKSAPVTTAAEPNPPAETTVQTESARSIRSAVPSYEVKPDTPSVAGKGEKGKGSDAFKKRTSQKRTVTVRIYLR